MTTYIRLSSAEVAMLSKKGEKPRVVRRYRLAEEYMNYSQWWYIVPLTLGIGFGGLFIPGSSWIGVILLIPGIFFGGFLMKGLLIRASFLDRSMT